MRILGGGLDGSTNDGHVGVRGKARRLHPNSEVGREGLTRLAFQLTLQQKEHGTLEACMRRRATGRREDLAVEKLVSRGIGCFEAPILSVGVCGHVARRPTHGGNPTTTVLEASTYLWATIYS